jgi:hypothetical protein
VNAEFEELIRLYSALEESGPDKQAANLAVFEAAIKAAAEKYPALSALRISAYVKRQWHLRVLAEDRRKSLPKQRS